MKTVTTILIVSWLALIGTVQAQLDTKHFIPPIYYGLAEGGSDRGNFDRHYLVLSTPTQELVDVIVKDGSGNVLLDTQISNSNPLVHILGRLSDTGVYRKTDPSGTGNVVGTSKLNKVNSDGLIIEASAPVYANIRHQSTYQGGSLTSKGRPALGNEFRVATMRNNDVLTHNYRSLFFSMMAVENDTVIEIDQIKPGIVFTNTSASGSPKTTNAITVTLQAGESYVVGIKNDLYTEQGGTATLNDVNGTRVRSSKPIAMNTGTVLGCPDRNNFGSRDMGFDQIAPVSRAGKEYLLVKGAANNGSDLETTIVVAVKNNTDIYVGDSLTPVNESPLNAGDYLFLAGAYDANGLLNFNSSEPVLTWQTMAGSNSAATPGLNFVPPLNEDIATSVDNIGDINLIGDATVNIVARAGHPVFVNGAAPETGPISVTGTDEWVAYSQKNLTGNPKIESTGAIAVSLVMLKNPIGAGAYYSGYPSFKPLIETVDGTGQTLPGVVLKAVDPSGGVYTQYEWFHADGTPTGVIGETFTPTEPGEYYIVATSGSTIAPSGNSAGFTVNRAPEADLEIVIVPDLTQVNPGDKVFFTATLTNHGPDQVENIEIKNIIPKGFVYLPGSITGGDRNSEETPSTYGLIWKMNSLSATAGENTVTFTYSATARTVGETTVSINAQSQTNEPTLFNNFSSTAVVIAMPADGSVPEDCCNPERIVDFEIRDLDFLERFGVQPLNYDAARRIWEKVRTEFNCDAQGTLLEEEKRGFREEDFYIAEDSEVIVTVIYDGAEQYNTVSFYNAADPENSWKTIWESFVTGPSAPLIPGSSASLGVIPAGTELRFGLIMDGARGGSQKIYQDAYLNPGSLEMTASNVFLDDADAPLIIAFEDQLYEGRDNDYNDVILKIEIIPTALGVAQHDETIAELPGLNSNQGTRGVSALLANYGMDDKDMEQVGELFHIPAGLNQLSFDLLDDRSSMKFTLCAVDYELLQATDPTSLEFRQIAAQNAIILMDDRVTEPGQSTSINPIIAGLDGKDVILFIIPNNTLETYLTNPWRYTPKGNDNRTKRQPLFTMNNANPQAKDQFLVFSDGYSTLLAIEDHSRTEDDLELGEASDDSFDDIQLQIRPALECLAFHNGAYFVGTADPTVGFTGPDGYSGTSYGGY